MFETILKRLETTLDPSDYYRWIRPLQGVSNGSTLQILAPNRYVFEYVQNNCMDEIKEVANSVYGKPMQIDLGFSNPNNRSFQKRSTEEKPNGETKLSFGLSLLNPDFTLDNYVLGDSNNFAYAAAVSVAENPGAREANPLFIYGNVGIGKTHLMQAVGHQMIALNPAAKVGYVQSSNYVEHLLRQFRRKDADAVEQFKLAYRSLDALLVDDVHLFAGARASQNEFFNTFNQLLELNKQIIITCNQYYRELKEVEYGLRSRFGQGIVTPIYEPEFEHRVNILINKAEKIGIELPDKVCYFIAEKVKPDVRELEGALNRVCAHHRFYGHPITIDVVKKVLRDMLRYNSRPLELDDIVQVVSNYYTIRVEDILSESRKANLVRARQLSMLLARELTTKSLPEIGKHFGGRHHTSVIHSCRQLTKKLEDDAKLGNEYSTLKNTLNY